VFARLGGLHRNTFINSPKVLDDWLRLRADPRLRFAGQITGVEGYVESAAMGLLAGRMAAADHLRTSLDLPPPTTALGALLGHITGGHLDGGARSFQPMNINYGLLPPIGPPVGAGRGARLARAEKGRARKRLVSLRALNDLEAWLSRAGSQPTAGDRPKQAELLA
jgi:methylenetetrahydrofolate--tRNA-(uracil-5-)-methyltransferase